MNDYSQPPPIPEPNKGNEQKRAQPATPLCNRPICSITSLVIQVVAFIILVTVIILNVDVGTKPEELDEIMIVILFYLSCSVLGVVLAIISFMRKERFIILSTKKRFIVLSGLALLLNVLGPILLFCFVTLMTLIQYG